ncbi:hypothetical protein DL240_19070 [Lujinxingia litoralis]|uniref:Lipoprotein n=1 Tax=Lujinxingia litoralis TaxID=2211119 RepID=A0A328C0H1_9DELT|nr:hypothetical protein [Lujinxingia litoralis]RAL20066.1 hypothetical protein DL240_19070 [Lujinxingia litoralis]
MKTSVKAMMVALILGLSPGMSGCVVGGYHQRINSSFEEAGQARQAEGFVNAMELGVVADFRYLRLGMPFEGQQREFVVEDDQGRQLTTEDVVELRSLRLDVPLWSFRNFETRAMGYPGVMPRRKSLELWASGSLGLTPTDQRTVGLGLVYYRYGSVAVRLHGDYVQAPYSGRVRELNGSTPWAGHAPGWMAGLEVTVAAGEYALELIKFVLDVDRTSRERSEQWAGGTR